MEIVHIHLRQRSQQGKERTAGLKAAMERARKTKQKDGNE